VGIKATITAASTLLIGLLKLDAPVLDAISVPIVVLGVLAIATNIEVELVDEEENGRRRRRLVVTRRNS
jgi:hypothetical protein